MTRGGQGDIGNVPVDSEAPDSMDTGDAGEKVKTSMVVPSNPDQLAEAVDADDEQQAGNEQQSAAIIEALCREIRDKVEDITRIVDIQESTPSDMAQFYQQLEIYLQEIQQILRGWRERADEIDRMTICREAPTPSDDGGDEVRTPSMVVPRSAEKQIAATIRRIVHEVNNQASAMSMIAEHQERFSSRDLATFFKNLRTCLRRIGHILKIASRRAGIEPLKIRYFNVQEEFQNWMTELVAYYGEKTNTQFESAGPNRAVHIYADPDCIAEVLMNLVRNAIFSMAACAERPSILKLRLEATGNIVSIVVIDNGAGFAEEVLCRKGGTWISTNEEPGHGIGLNTCNDLLRRMNATFQVQNNKSPEHGATVSMTFQHAPTPCGDQ